MSGTHSGGLQASQTNKLKYGKDFYREIGKKGGSVSHPETRPFARNKDLAKLAGRRGGTISRRGKGKFEVEIEEIDRGVLIMDEVEDVYTPRFIDRLRKYLS